MKVISLIHESDVIERILRHLGLWKQHPEPHEKKPKHLHMGYWVATDRRDLAAEQVAFVYKLRWQIEKFFAWWKRHLKVYHLVARTEYGLMVQILSGLITYLLLAIYCHKHYQEKVSIKRVRELRIKIQNELRDSEHKYSMASDSTEQPSDVLYAKT